MLAELALAGGAFAAALTGTYGVSQAAHSEPSHHDTVSAAPCSSDDGSGSDPCYWNAETMGNHHGASYVMVHGTQHSAASHSDVVKVGNTYYKIGK